MMGLRVGDGVPVNKTNSITHRLSLVLVRSLSVPGTRLSQTPLHGFITQCTLCNNSWGGTWKQGKKIGLCLDVSQFLGRLLEPYMLAVNAVK